MTYTIKGTPPNLALHYCMPSGAWVEATFLSHSYDLAHEAAYRISVALKGARSLMADILHENNKPTTLVTEPAP
jgi:hypothetical protein